MPEPTSLKQLFQTMAPDGAGIIQGRVVSAEPLKIQAVNDEKLTLTENLLCIPKHLTEYKTTVSIPELELKNAEITVHNALKSGETVYILSFNGGKKYYILDRSS
jgi:hypothetical protein